MPDLQEVFGSISRVKILVVLAKMGELNISAVSKKTKLNHSRVCEHIEKLQNLQIIEQKRYGRIRIIRLNKSSEAGRRIEEFFKHWDTGFEIFSIKPL